MRRLIAAISMILLCIQPAYAQNFSFGYRPAPPGKFGAIPKALSPLIDGALPSSVDLSDDMPPPGDQGNQQSCVAWAVAYALKSQQEKVERGWIIYDTNGINFDRVFSPSFIYNQINGGTDSGSNFADAFRILITQGAAPLSAMPYTASPFAPVPSAAQSVAGNFRADTFRTVDPSDVSEVKAQLAAGHPLVIAGRMYQQFHNLGPDQVWTTATGPVIGRHAMTLVGYDDSKGAFKVINSWGTNWGSAGYGWIEYNLFGLVIDEAYLVVDLKGEVMTSADVPDDKWSPPSTVSEEANLTITNFLHNQFDNSGIAGMIVTGTLTIPAGVQGNARIVISLQYQTGPAVEGLSPLFRLASGQAAFGTPPLPLDGKGISGLTWQAFMPYCALGVPKTKLCMPVPTPPWVPPALSNLRAEPTLFIDNFGVAKGPSLNFFVKM
jgi:hypothetical protein